MINDKTLIKQILTGDNNAFQTLVRQNERLVTHVVFRMLNSNADREDVCQDIFLKVYRYLPGFKFDSKLSTWIAKIAYNTCINYLEKKKIPLYDDNIFECEGIEDFSSKSVQPDTLVEGKDVSKKLKHIIEELPVKYRTIVTLYHLEEMSYREISKIMNLPEGTVKSHLFRARKILRIKLMATYQQEDLLR